MPCHRSTSALRAARKANSKVSNAAASHANGATNKSSSHLAQQHTINHVNRAAPAQSIPLHNSTVVSSNSQFNNIDTNTSDDGLNEDDDGDEHQVNDPDVEDKDTAELKLTGPQCGHRDMCHTWVYQSFHEPETTDTQVVSDGPMSLLYPCKHCISAVQLDTSGNSNLPQHHMRYLSCQTAWETQAPHSIEPGEDPKRFQTQRQSLCYRLVSQIICKSLPFTIFEGEELQDVLWIKLHPNSIGQAEM
ncbi:hypothetical protein CROQUDRAFT_602842 [Cronartium quercuum f. sp. fusiforme G11]|uniref:Uncharacterized protein n=1 Tax=Cronartium quercuum f. sp. fusiforme G11 TaxID=708437 RepID=A0A9P6NJS0_9BASI|nr:hypothetical protein CROQUDRAFT_602842 [Cronartium quercuum f. sp. fusiforme G11]